MRPRLLHSRLTGHLQLFLLEVELLRLLGEALRLNLILLLLDL